MPRRSLGPRLYLDPRRRQWVIRDGQQFIRTGADEGEPEKAKTALARYQGLGHERPTGFVYFLTAAARDYPIKVGFTERMASVRIQSLQGGCPYALYFLGHILGTMADERLIHRRFDHLRLRGEWFQRDPELIDHIRSLCFNFTEIAA